MFVSIRRWDDSEDWNLTHITQKVRIFAFQWLCFSVNKNKSYFLSFLVILAPFGLAGTLINQNNNGPAPSADPAGTRLLEAWKHFYPLASGCVEPQTVEVAVGGARMRYPVRYVLLTEAEDAEQPAYKMPPPSMASEYLPPKLSAVLSKRTLTELGIGQQVSVRSNLNYN